ncbi:MFS transporter [Sphingobium yanoikuyae]|uniref:MFS transporter n=1 Tax=Sphingobium yanoikuyae TaxID=13690 RepID=UPI00345E7AFF
MTAMTMAPASLTIQSSAYGKIAWRVLPFLLLCYLAAYIDRVNIGFAKLQMASDLAFSEAAYGLGAGIFFIGYAICEVPSNLMLHKVGARRWIARILISWSLVSACFGLVQTEMHFYILRFLLGVAEAGFAPGALLYLTYWFPSARRSRANMAMFLAIPLAGIIGAPLSGLIMENMSGVMQWEGWRWMFVLEALPALVAGLLTWRFLPDRPADVDWLTMEEKQIVQADLAADAGERIDHMSISQFLGDKRLWLLTAIYFMVVMGQYAITFWLPTIVKNAGAVSPVTNGLLTSLPFIAAMLSMLAFSFSADRKRERRWHLITPMVAGALALTLASFVPHNMTLSIILLSVAAAGMLTSTVMFWSLPPAFLGGIWAAAGIGAINSIGNVAGFVSPYLIGSLVSASGDLRLGLYAIAGSVLFGAALVLLVPKSANR